MNTGLILGKSLSIEAKPRGSGRPSLPLLLGLTVIAFTTITAGIGLIQAYYSAIAITTSNTTILGSTRRILIEKQANILFPLGQFLLTVGLAIVLSIFIQFLLSMVRIVRQEGRRTMLVSVFVVAVGMVGGLIAATVPPHSSIFQSLWSAFGQHYSFFVLFIVLCVWFTVALTVVGKRTIPKSEVGNLIG